MTDDKMITTSLVHSRDTGEAPWWRNTVVCDIPGLHGKQSLASLRTILQDLAESGFEALLVRPTSPQVEDDVVSLPSFVEEAHAQGLKVLVRIFLLPSGAVLSPPDTLPQLGSAKDIKRVTERIVGALHSGADGVDLGTIDINVRKWAPKRQQAAFSEAVQVALAEIAVNNESAILGAALPAFPEAEFSRHLEDDWFHHLRSSKMLEVSWNAADLQDAVVSAYRAHDPLGHTVPWRHVWQRWSPSKDHVGSSDVGWAKDAPLARYGAMNLFVSSLPGAVYLPFLYTGGSAVLAEDSGTDIVLEYGQGDANAYRSVLNREMLNVRKREGMGTAPLAFVSGLEWANNQVSVHLTGSVMVVLNVNSAPITVPVEHRLLVASDGAMPAPGGGTILPSETCAWFRTAEPTPLDPGQYQ